jgi:hypothetical protein
VLNPLPPIRYSPAQYLLYRNVYLTTHNLSLLFEVERRDTTDDLVAGYPRTIGQV